MGKEVKNFPDMWACRVAARGRLAAAARTRGMAHVAEQDVVNGLREIGISDSDIAANAALVTSCVKAYTKPVPSTSPQELSDAEITDMRPKLEAFFRPGQVLASRPLYVMPQERLSFGEFAEKELYSDHFKFFLAGWGLSMFLVTYLALNITPEMADDSAFIKSMRMRDGQLLKEDRDRLAAMGKL